MRLIIIIAVFILSGCSPQVTPFQYQRTGEVNAVNHENSIITISSQSRAETLIKAITFAERNAFENLLFKGVPNTNQESPLIENEFKALDANNAFFDRLLVQHDYKRFIMDSYTHNSSKKNGVILLDQVVKIDINALRKHLQQEGITRKFGL